MKNPATKAIIVFIVLFIVTQLATYQSYLIRKNIIQNEVLREINSVKDRLEKTIGNSLAATQTLAFIVEEYGVPKNFASVAKNILESNKNIDALQLTKKGLITNTYPLKGNEAAIGFNVLEAPLHRSEALKALLNKKLYFAGPFELRQGGKGVVGRLPVFINDEFFGFSVVIIKLSTLLESVGINTSSNQFVYQLSKINPTTQQEECFIEPYIIPDKNQSVSVAVPDGEWKLHIMQKGSTLSIAIIAFSLLGLVLSLVSAFFVWYWAKQPKELQRLVDEKTSELLSIKNNYQTTLERVNDAFIALDKNLRYTYINSKAGQIMNCDPKDMIGKSIGMEFSGAFSKSFCNSCQKAMNEQQTVFIEDYCSPDNQFYEIHIYASPEGLSIYIINVTEKRNREEEIHKTLKEKKAVLSRISDSVISVDNDWRYTYLNDAALSTHPLGREQTIGKVIWEVHPGLKNTIAWEKYNEARLTKKVVETEFFYPELNKYFTIRIYPSDDGLTIFYRDDTERKIVEKKLFESELNYRSLVENAVDAIFIADENGKYTAVNISACKLLGYTKDEFLTMSRKDIIFDENRVAELPQRDTELKQSKAYISENILKRKDGSQVVVETNSWKLPDGKFVGIARDITERKKAEETINKSRLSLSEAQKLAKIGSWETDLPSLKTIRSEEVLRILEVETEENPSSQPALTYVHPEDIDKVNEAFRVSLKKDGLNAVEHRILTPTGKVKYVEERWRIQHDDQGNAAKAIGTCQDITERKNAEKLEADINKRLKAIFNGTNDAILLTDDNGKYIQVNPAAVRMLGYSQTEFLQKTVSDVISKNSKPTLWSEFIESGTQTGTIELIRKDGVKIICLYNASANILPNLNLSILTNITEYTKAEEEKKSSYKQLQELTGHLQTVREEERTRIAREIHDELGQQLTGLKMDASWISKKIKGEDELISGKLSDMIDLIDNTVKTIRRISSELRPGILDDLGLIPAMEWLGQDFEKRNGIKVSFHSDHSNLNLDSEQSTNIFRIYQEALTNIAKHAKASQIKTTLKKEMDSLVLSIKDDGQGFDVTEVTDKKTWGLIGMKERALLIKGKLTIESEEGAGTCITLKIPLK